MQLIIFELATFQDARLNSDFLLDCVGEVVIDSVGALENVLEVVFVLFVLPSFSALFLHRALLDQHLST